MAQHVTGTSLDAIKMALDLWEEKAESIQTTCAVYCGPYEYQILSLAIINLQSRPEIL